MANGGTTISLLPVGTATPAIGVAGASAPIVELHGGPVAATAVSALGDARLIAGTDGLLYASENGGAYAPLSGGGGATPWQRTGTFVALDQALDTQVNPFTDDVTSLGTAALRWASVLVGAGATGGVRVFDTSGGPNPTAELKSALKFSAAGGAGALDIELARFGAKKFSVGDNAGGSGAIIPLTNVSPDGTLGDQTHNWRELWSRTLFMPDSAPVVSLPLAGFGYCYTKSVLGTVELFYQPSVGAAVQITPLGAASPWQRIVNIVNLTVGTDTEVNPGADNTTVLGTSALRWNRVVTSSNGLSAFNLNTDTFAAGRFAASGLSWGTGAVAADAGLQRTGVGIISVTNPDSGSSGSLYPFASNSGTIGGASDRWASMATGSTGYSVFATNAAANPTTRVGSATIVFGPGAAVAVDVGLARSATGANTIELTNGGAGSGNFQPLVAATGKLGTTGTAISKAFQSAAVTTDFLVVTASTDANPTTRVAGASLQMGAGGAVAVDVEIKRVAANILALSDAGAGTGSLVPNTDTQGSLGTNGAGGKTWASMSATSLAAYAAGTDTQPKIEMRTAAAGGEVRMGAGVAAAPDVYLSRTGAGTLTADDGAGNGITIVPSVDGTGNVGTAAKRFSLVRAVTITSGDVCFDDQTCQVCGQPFAEGDDLVLRVIRIEPDGDTGRRLTRTVPAHHGCK